MDNESETAILSKYPATDISSEYPSILFEFPATVVETASEFDLQLDSTKIISRRCKVLFESLQAYFNKKKIQEQLLPFLIEKNISGRMCDYLMTTYSKKNWCPVPDTDIDVRQSYNFTLREAGGRCFFDPFNRVSTGIAVTVIKDGRRLHCTTLAQLNFIRWYFFNKINVFLMNNRAAISNDMRETYRDMKKLTTDSAAGIKRKRKTLFDKCRETVMVVCKKKTVIAFN